jgi:hypothetical protein
MEHDSLDQTVWLYYDYTTVALVCQVVLPKKVVQTATHSY